MDKGNGGPDNNGQDTEASADPNPGPPATAAPERPRGSEGLDAPRLDFKPSVPFRRIDWP
jgi:hypothetical protein